MELSLGYDLELSDDDYFRFAKMIYDLSGIDLGENKKELVKARLAKRMRALQLKSYSEYFEHLENDPQGTELVEMLNVISTNVTSFYRERQHFDYMDKVALPEIVARKKKAGTNKIRIWSAASSTGEEVCTLLFVLADYLRSFSGWDIKILGTDISTKALAVAEIGMYNLQKLREIPQVVQSRYLERVTRGNEQLFKVRNELHDLAVFRRLNLMDETYPFQGKFDIIFCRNVMIYFDKETQGRLVQRMCRYLDEGGYLFIGHSESLLNLNTGLTTMAPATFKKIK
jgi:chemotaxis protein methyltransferase CheR